MMQSKTIVLSVLACAALMFGLDAGTARADNLLSPYPVSVPNAVFSDYANGTGLPATIGSGQADIVGSSCTLVPAGCQTSEGKTVAVGIIAQADGTTSGVADSQGTAIIVYSFEVTGTTQEFVPLSITGFASAAADGPDVVAQAEISYSFVDGDGFESKNFTVEVVANGISNPNPQPKSGNLFDIFDQATNVLGDVSVMADCGSDGFPGYATSCGASADPVISIDPAFLAANPGVTLELSQGVEQSPVTTTPPTAPEPSALVLLAAALPLIAAIRKRRMRIGANSELSRQIVA